MRWLRPLFFALFALMAPTAAFGAGPPLWFDGGQPSLQAQQALEMLGDVRSHGLDPADYDALLLARAFDDASRGPLDAEALAALDRRLTRAMERYLADLHHGRVAPDRLPNGYAAGTRDIDAGATLRAALASGRLADAQRAAAPRFAQYERLREALAHHRALVDHPAWVAPLPPLPPGAGGDSPKLEPGHAYAGAPALRARLVALGDLPSAVAAGGAVYDETLAEGVRTFQRRHGLAVDGVVGRATLAQLDVTPAVRARQIELMLERLRWTPLLQGARMVVINIPEFVLRAYEVDVERIAVRATMKVIVGKALDTRTPLFVAQMRAIEFQPYWNVPPSIARKELVPRLRRDPAHWDREGFEFVVGGQIETGLSAALLDEAAAGRARIRQRPGLRNALGDIKFVFPNDDNIYLHHTPSVGLFARDRRDFSHGCIRVEQPVALAEFVLQGTAQWDEVRVRQAMRDGDPKAVRLAEPLPVLIAYGTALVKEGRVHFYDDIYGHDRALDAALRQPRPPLSDL